MLRTLIGRALVAAALGSACTAPRQPVLLLVSTSGRVPARIEVLRKEGAIRPLDCPAPCNFKVSQDAEADLKVTADGYFPAVIPFSHSVLWVGETSLSLVVPLLKRGEQGAEW